MSKSDTLEHPELRKVWDRLETESPPIEWHKLTSLRFEPTRTSPRGLWMAVGVFAVVVVIGGLGWLARGSNGVDPGGLISNLDWDLVATFSAPADPEAFVEQVETIEGVSSVDYYPNASVLWSSPVPDDGNDEVVVTTVRGPQPTGEEPITAAVLIQIEDPAVAETIAHVVNQRYAPYSIEYAEEVAAPMADRYFEAITAGAVAIGEDPLTFQAAPGPEPEFDTTGLGTEVVLIPASDAGEIPDMFWEFSTMTILEEIDVRSPDSPVYHMGYLEETGSRMVVYRSVGGERCVEVLEPEGGAGGGCGNGMARYRYGVSGYGGIEGETANLRVEVPLQTAVVAVTVDGGTPMWQRPVAGLGLFPAEIEDYDFARFTVDAYDAVGASLGRWEYPPD